VCMCVCLCFMCVYVHVRVCVRVCCGVGVCEYGYVLEGKICLVCLSNVQTRTVKTLPFYYKPRARTLNPPTAQPTTTQTQPNTQMLTNTYPRIHTHTMLPLPTHTHTHTHSRFAHCWVLKMDPARLPAMSPSHARQACSHARVWAYTASLRSLALENL